jgi:hypothetical protein
MSQKHSGMEIRKIEMRELATPGNEIKKKKYRKLK